MLNAKISAYDYVFSNDSYLEMNIRSHGILEICSNILNILIYCRGG